MDYKKYIKDYSFIIGKDITEKDFGNLITESIAMDRNSLNHRIAVYVYDSINYAGDLNYKIKDKQNEPN